jgi:colanic acid biosynthesis glycosyl transferase WcaI
MRILIIGGNYAPEETGIAPYTTGLAEHLVSRGHSVVALTGFPSYPEWRVHNGHRGLLWRRETIRGVDVHRRWRYVPPVPSVVGRGAQEGTFLLAGLSAVTLPRPDVVLGVVPGLSAGLLARLVARRFRVPYGLILQDLVARAAGQSGLGLARPAVRLLRAAEGCAARGAAAVGIIAEGFRPYVESLAVEPARIRRLRNWTHIGEVVVDRAAVRERLDLPQDAAVCLHAGNMGSKQGLDNVVECARLAAGAAEGLRFVLMGDGSQRPYLEALAARYALPNLRFLPLQPAGVFPSVLASADILLVNQRASVVDMSLPSKLASYFAVGRPVVAAVDPTSEAAREVRTSGAGRVVTPDAPKALLDGILALLEDRAGRERLGAAGRRYAAEFLEPAPVLREYEAFVQCLLSGGSATADVREGTRLRAPNNKEVVYADRGTRRGRLSRLANGVALLSPRPRGPGGGQLRASSSGRGAGHR